MMMVNEIKLDPVIARRNYFLNKLSLLKESMKESEESDYVIDGLCKIYTELIERNQFADISVDEPTMTDMLIRSYRYIPPFELDYRNIDRVVIGGLFVVAKVCLLPAEAVNKCTRSNRLGAYYHPENFGLPSIDQVYYSTIRKINAHTYSVLVKGEWYDGWLTNRHQYEVVTLNDQI